MMRTRSHAILLGSILVAASFSGCVNAQALQDWWDDRGTVIVRVGTLPASAPGQHVNDFSTVKVALRSTTVYAANEISALAGVRYSEPLGVDLKKRFDDGEFLRVLEAKVPTKTVDRIAFSLYFVEAKDHAGNIVPMCPMDGSEPESRPCIAIAPAGGYEFDLTPRPTAIERGGTTEFHFPLAVGYDEKKDEYYIQGRSHKSEAPVIVK